MLSCVCGILTAFVFYNVACYSTVIQSIEAAKNGSSCINFPNCGVSKVIVTDADRIVGGREAIEGEFPWQVSVQFKISPGFSVHLCGAAILNEKFIITAAHCVDSRYAEYVVAVIGVHSLREKNRYVSSYPVEKIITHEKFDHAIYLNDIALMKLKDSILFEKYDGFVNSICLPEVNRRITGFSTAAGWGDTSENGRSSDVLRTVELPIVAHDVCWALYGGSDLISKTVLCAGRSSGGIDTCQGDSGGPLIQRNRNGTASLIGIVSWGVGCARRGFPGVYTLVPSYVDWIMTHIKE